VYFKTVSCDLERNARSAGPGTNVQQRAVCGKIGECNEWFEKESDDHGPCFGYAGEIHASIPGAQLLEKSAKEGQLVYRQLNPEFANAIL
jgi:hypothetical protein